LERTIQKFSTCTAGKVRPIEVDGTIITWDQFIDFVNWSCGTFQVQLPQVPPSSVSLCRVSSNPL